MNVTFRRPIVAKPTNFVSTQRVRSLVSLVTNLVRVVKLMDLTRASIVQRVSLKMTTFVSADGEVKH